MIKTITLYEGQTVELNSSAGWLFKYRAQFGHDILPDIMPAFNAVSTVLLEAIEGDTITIDTIKSALDSERVQTALYELAGLEITTLLNITWSMAKNAKKEIEAPEEWAEKLESFPVDIVVPELFNMILASSVSTKNLQALQTKIKALKG